MKKILFILFSIAMISNAQNFYCTKTIDTSGCRLMFFNATLVKHSEIDLSTMTYSRDAVGSYIIKDGNGTQVTIKNDGCLVTPSFTNLGTYLNGVRSACSSVSSTIPTNLDTTQTDTSLINYASQLDTIRNLLDTIRKYLKDTIDFEYHSFCYRSKIDSGVYEFSKVFDVRSPSVPYYMTFTDVDSLLSIYSYMNGISTGNYPDISKDYIPCDKWAEYLKRNVASDTLKKLVFKAQTKRIDGTVDTLYNCKGISFSVSSNATGNIIFYYGDGDQDVYDVATEQLPHWENGSFVEFLGWDASAVAGVVRINKLGCSDVPETICAKEKTIINCTTNTPIHTCVGWASVSGVWFSSSGCWNTGQ